MLKQKPHRRVLFRSTLQRLSLRVFFAVVRSVIATPVISYTRVRVGAHAGARVRTRIRAGVPTRELGPKVATSLAMVAMVATLGFGLLHSAGVATAAPADTLNFQARLENSDGAIANDGNYNVQFNLYSSATGGSPIWTESHLNSAGTGIRVVNGYLSVYLGSVTPFPANMPWDQGMYVTMNIGGTSAGAPSYDGEMNPRLKLTAVPYAFQAKSATQLQVTNGPNVATLGFVTPTASNTILLPDASGTLCLANSNNCGFATSSGSSNYIQNGTALQAGANFNIQTGAAGTPTEVIQALTGQTADLIQLRNSDGAVTGGFNASGNLFYQSGSFTGTLVQDTLARNVTYHLPAPNTTATSVYLCLSTGNCAGSGNGITGTGATNYVARFDSNSTIGASSLLYDDGAFVGINTILNGGSLSVASTNASQAGAYIRAADSATAPALVLQLGSSPSLGGDFLQLKDADGTILSSIAADGKITTAGGLQVAGAAVLSNTLTVGGNAAVLGGGLTLGNSGSSTGVLNLANAGTTFSTSLQAATPSIDQTITIPNAGGDDQICLRTLGNCAGSGGGITGAGTQYYLARFTTPAGNYVGVSNIYDNGNFVGVGTTTNNGLLSLVGTTPNQATLFAQAAASATTPVAVIRGGATPTSNADLLQLQTSTGSIVAKFDQSGNFTTSGFASIGSGLTVTAGGATITGATSINTTGTGTTSIGNSGSNFNLSSTGLNVTTSGAVSGVTGYNQANGDFTFNGANLTTGSGTVTFGNLGGGLVQSSSTGLLSSGAVGRNDATFFSDTLSVENGGTGAASFTSNGIVFGNGTGALQVTNSAADSILITDASGVPSFSGTLPTAVQGTISQVGALSAGSIANGFGTISTANNITTTATVQGNSVNATGTGAALQLNGQNINSAGVLTNVAYLNATSQSFSGANRFTGNGTALTVDNDASIGGTLTTNVLSVTTNATIGGGLTVSGAAGIATGVAGSTAGSLILYNSTNTHKTTLQGIAAAGQDQVITIPASTAATDTVCLQTLKNCATANSITGIGTAGYVARFDGTNTLATGLLYDNGSTMVGVNTTTNNGTLSLKTVGSQTGFYVEGAATGVNAIQVIKNGGSTGDFLDFVSNANGTVAKIDADGKLYAAGANITGQISGTYSGANASGVSLATTNSSATGTSVVNGINLNLAGTNTTGSNTNIALNLADVTAKTNNSFIGLNFGTGYNSLVSYNGTSVINGAGQLNLNQVYNTLGVANGGTGTTALTSNGILFGNGSGVIQATAASANSILVTDGSNAPSLSQTLPIAVQGNITQVGALTAGSIGGTFGAITTNAAITGNTLNATGTGAAFQLNGTDINVAGTLSNVSYLNQANTFSAASNTFSGNLNVQGSGGLIVGNGTTDGAIVLAKAGSAFTTTIKTLTPVGQNQTVVIPATTDPSGTDTICLQTLANCGTAGAVLGSGTQNYIARFDTNGNHVGNSLLYDNGSFVGLNTTTNSGLLSVVGNSASQSSFFVQQAASSTTAAAVIKGGATPASGGDLLQLQSSNGSVLARVDKSGVVYAAGFDTQTATALNIGASNATEINLKKDTKVNGTLLSSGALTVQAGGADITGVTNFRGNVVINDANTFTTGTGTVTLGSLGAGLVQSSSTGALSSGTVDRNSDTFFSGTLSVANGGTGAATFTSNGLLYGNAAGALQATAAGTTGQLLFAGTDGTPIFATLGGDLASSTSAAGQVTVNKLQGNNLSITTPTSGQYIRYDGSAFVNSAIQASDLPDLGGSYIKNTTTQQTTANFNIQAATGTVAAKIQGAESQDIIDFVTSGGSAAAKIDAAGVLTATGATLNGNVSIAAGKTFTNASSTLLSALTIADKPMGGSVGASTATVDVATTLNVNQTTAGQNIILPAPSDSTGGRILYINNVGTAMFTIGSVTLYPGSSASYIWNGGTWVALTTGSSSTGVTTVGTLDNQPRVANGAVINGSTLFLQTADATNAGLVGTGNQTFAGEKTFSNKVTLAANASGLGLSVTNGVEIGGTLAVAGSTTFNGSVEITGTNTFKTGTGSVTIGSLGAGIVQSSSTGVLSSGAIDRNSTTLLTGTTSVANGGTGATTFAANGVLFGNATGALQATAAGTSGQILQANASGAPTFVTQTGDVTLAVGGATTVNKLQGTTLSIAGLATGQVIRYNGTGFVNSAITAADIAGALFTLQGSTGSAQPISAGSTVSILAGASGNVTSVASNTSTITVDITQAPTFTGKLSLSTTAGQALDISGAPTATAGQSLIKIGNALNATNSSANGTYLGINQPNSGAADFINLQVNGVSKYKATSTGATTQADTLTVSGGGFAVTGNSTLTGTLSSLTGLSSSGAITFSGLGAGIVQAGSGGALTSGAVDRNSATLLSGTLNVANGGTGAASFTTNGIVFGNGTNALQVTAAGTSGQLLFANASGVPTFGSLSGDVSASTTTPGQVTINKLQGNTLTISAPTSGQFIRYNGTAFVNSALQASDLPDLGSNYIKNAATQQTVANFNIQARPSTVAAVIQGATGQDIISFVGSGGSQVAKIDSAGQLVAVGVNAGSGLLQGAGGLTITGTTGLNGTTAVNVNDTAAFKVGSTTNANTFVVSTTDNKVAIGAPLVSTGGVLQIGGNTTSALGGIQFGTDANASIYRSGTNALTVGGALSVTGNLTATNGTIDSGAATTNLVNSGTTTVNFAGAATTVKIGAATGTTTINNNIDVKGTTTLNVGTGVVQSVAGVLSSGAIDRNSATLLSGTLNVANGGTGATTLTSNGILFGNGAGAVQATAAGTAGQLLFAGADGTPAFSNLGGDLTASATTVGSVKVSKLQGYGLDLTTTAPINGQYLKYNGTNFVASSIQASDVAGTLFTLKGSTGTDQTVSTGSTVSVLAGTSGNITSVASATNTITVDITQAPTFTGKLTLSTTAGQALDISGAPAAAAGQSLVKIGNALSSATSSTNGTYLGINAPSTSSADFANFQKNGATQFRVYSDGSTFLNGGLTIQSGGIDATGGITFRSLGAGLVKSSSTGALTSGVIDRNDAAYFNTTLSVANGGTGATSFNAKSLLYGNGTSALQAATVGTAGQALFAASDGTPTFTTMSGDLTASTSTIGSISVSKLQGYALDLTTTAPVANQVLKYVGGKFVPGSVQFSEISGTVFTLHGGTGTDQSVTSGSTVNIIPKAGGTGNITTTASASNTISIDITATPTFSTILLNGTGKLLDVAALPTASASQSLIKIGDAAITGGNANGTFIGLNTSTTTAADLINLQNAGVLRFKVAADGSTTVANKLTVNSGGLAVTGDSTIAGTLTGLTGLTSSGAVKFTGLNSVGVAQTAADGTLSTGTLDRNSSSLLSGTLSVANGGTGATSFTTNGIPYYDGTKLASTTALGGSVLVTDPTTNVPSLSQTLPQTVQGNITKLGTVTSGQLSTGFGQINTQSNITTNQTVQGNVVNASTGFQVGTAAAAGAYLRGNGTNFVSSSLLASDLSGTLFNLAASAGAAQAISQGNTITIAKGTSNNLTTSVSGTTLTVDIISNPTFTGAITSSSATTGLALTGSLSGGATSSLLQIGSAIAGGNANGTYIGVNAPNGNTADFINLQSNGVTKLRVDSTGRVSAAGGYAVGTNVGVTSTCAAGSFLGDATITGGLVTAATCSSSSTAITLQNAYNNSGSATPQIALNSAYGGLKITDDGTTNVTGNLFQVTSSGTSPSSIYLGVSKTTVAVKGTLSVTGGYSQQDTSTNNFGGQTNFNATGSAVTIPNGSLTVGSAASNQLVVSQNGSETHAFSSSNSASATTYNVVNTDTGPINSLVNALNINLSGSANTSGQYNLTYGVNFANVTPTQGNRFYGLNFGTGFTNLLTYSGAALIDGGGILQNAAISNTVDYSNLTKTGALISGSIVPGFGSISTNNNITTTAALQGNTLAVGNAAAGGYDKFTVDTNGNTINKGSLTVGISGSLQVASNGNLTSTGTIGLASTTAGNALSITTAPAGASNSALVQLGNTIAGGNTSGTYISINQPATGAGSAADFVNFQNAGTSKFVIDATGQVTQTGKLNVTSGGASISGSIVGSTIISAGTAYRINNVVGTAGTFLRNDGTNGFVAGTIQGSDGAGIFLRTTPASSSENTIAPTAAGVVGLSVKGSTAGGVNSLEIFNSAATPTRQAYFDANGSLNVNQLIQPLVNNAVDLGLSGTAFKTGYFGTSVLAGGTTLNATNLSFTGAGAISAGAGQGLSLTGNAASSLSTSAGSLSLQATAGAVNITAGAASSLNFGANTLAVTASNFSIATTGVVTLAGNNTTDITTITSTGTANSLSLQPGATSAATGTGGALNLRAGNATGTTSTGGSTTIAGGNGTTTGGNVSITGGTGSSAANNGTVSVGATNTSAVNLGSSTAPVTSNGSFTIASGQNQTITNGSFTQNYTVGANGTAHNITATNSNTSASSITLNGIGVAVTGTANTAGGTNTNNGINLGNVTAVAGNVFNGIVIGSGYNNLISNANYTVTAAGAVTQAAGLTVQGGGAAVTGNTSVTSGSFTSAGGAISLNNSSNFGTNINTGSSTGAVSIGNSAAGTISLQSGNAINLTAAAASSLNFGTNTLAVTASNFSVSTTGLTTIGAIGVGNTLNYLCRNLSNQIASCNTTGNGAMFVQGGNSFGSDAVLGTNDTYNLILRTNGLTRATLDQSGNLTFQQNSNVQTVSGSNLTVQTQGPGLLTLNGAAGGIVAQASGNISVTASGTATLALDTNTGAINIGTGGTVKAITLGSAAGASATNLQAGTGGLNLRPVGSGDTGVVIKPTNNSTAAFQIQNADASRTLLNVDTTNLRVRVGNNTGQVSTSLTLFQLDRSSGNPGTNTAFLGSMYFDTAADTFQCYNSSGWGACGAAPNVSVNLVPEYQGLVLHGTGIGTLTSDICSSALAINTTSGDQTCSSAAGATDDFNYYKWTSPQASNQTYSLYVRYQMPATFKSFAAPGTIKLSGRTTDASGGTNGVKYSMYYTRSDTQALTQCGTTTSVTGTTANTWLSTSLFSTGSENTCTAFNGVTGGIGPNTIVTFKIDVTASGGSSAYVGNLSFLTIGR